MTSVSKLTGVSPASQAERPVPARPVCAICRTPVEHTPGKRPRIYCSNACKQRAKRILARAEKAGRKHPVTVADVAAAAADGAAPGKKGRLGTETTEFRTGSDLRRRGGSEGPQPARRDAAGESEGAQRPSGDDAEDAREEAARVRKARRYAGRRTLWRITGDNACKGCGRDLMDPAAGVLLAQTAQGISVVLGLMRCARIWFCPVCSAVIRHKRAEEITRAVVEWIKRGGSAYLVTFTVRHDYGDALADLMDALQGTRKDDAAGIKRRPGAYQRLITGGTWAGDLRDKASDAAAEGIRGRIGYIGMIRATEVTVGTVNLWHPHIHAIVFVGGALASDLTTRTEKEAWKDDLPYVKVMAAKTIGGTFEPDPEALQEWEDHWRAVWTGHLAKVNPKYRPSDECGIPDCKCDGKGHGVDFKRLETVQDALNLGEYIAKTQDGKSPALELARGDLKEAGGGNLTPFELLYRIGDLTGGVVLDDDGPSLGWCLDRWHEYEKAVTGRRAIEWTRYLRALLGITGGDTEDDDKDLLLGADADSGEFRGGAAVTEEGWEATWRRGLDLAATEAAEGKDANTDPEAVARRVREVLDMAKAPADAVRALTSGEVSEAYAALLASMAERREAAAARRAREREREAGDRPGVIRRTFQ